MNRSSGYASCRRGRGSRTWPRSRRPPRPRRYRSASAVGGVGSGRRPGTWSASGVGSGVGSVTQAASASSASRGRAPRRARRTSSGQRHPPEALRGAIAGALAELLAAATDPARDLVEAIGTGWRGARSAAILRSMRARRCRPAGSPRSCSTGRARRPSTARGPPSRCSRKLSGSRAVGKTASTVTWPDRAMVGMVDPLVVDEQDGRVVGHDDLRAERADRVRDPLAQAQRRLDLPVRLVEEVDRRRRRSRRRPPAARARAARRGPSTSVAGSSLPLSPRVTSR